MANYNSIDEFYKELLNGIQNAMNKSLQEGLKKAQAYLTDDVYGSYNPIQYDRTMAMFNALEIKCYIKGNNVIGELYVKDGIHPKSRLNDRTFSGLYQYFAEGNAYGRDGKELDTIEYTNEEWIESEMAFDIILSSLKSQGFDIK